MAAELFGGPCSIPFRELLSGFGLDGYASVGNVVREPCCSKFAEIFVDI